MKLSIVIPCFNEAATVEAVFRAVALAKLPDGWDKEIVIVDDGSDAATKDALRRIEASSAPTPVVVVSKEKNEGKGAAVQTGLRRASGDYIVIQDADMEYDPNDYVVLLQPIIDGRTKRVLGSRVLKDNNVPYNAIFFYGGLLTTKLFNLLFGTRFSDIATCYKIFPREDVPELLSSHHKDFVFDAVDLTYLLARKGGIVEVPISYRARAKSGGKKLSASHGLRIVLAMCLLRLGVRSARQEETAHQVLRFLLAGTIAALINFAAFYLLNSVAGVWYVAASGLAFMIAFSANFFMQKYWTFRSREVRKMRHQLPLHLGAALVNLVINIALVYLLVTYVGFLPLPAQILATILIAFESFIVFRWIFR